MKSDDYEPWVVLNEKLRAEEDVMYHQIKKMNFDEDRKIKNN